MYRLINFMTLLVSLYTAHALLIVAGRTKTCIVDSYVSKIKVLFLGFTPCDVMMLILLLSTLLLITSAGVIEELTADGFAIVQFDSRPLDDYWLTSAQWNKAYCDQHGHQFLYYMLDGSCHYKEEPLASAWCKVKAMINAMEDHPAVKMFYYMDSDAVIDKAFAHLSLKDIALAMQQRLSWNPELKPVVFNQDGPCDFCRLVVEVGYTACLNAGTVVWYRHPNSEKVLRDWWDSTMDSYDTDPIKRFEYLSISPSIPILISLSSYCLRKFRLKWPWEQDRQLAIYNRSSTLIQVASQPERVFMQGKAGIMNGWCLSHLPRAECYISHYCAHKSSKQVMRRLYAMNETMIK